MSVHTLSVTSSYRVRDDSAGSGVATMVALLSAAAMATSLVMAAWIAYDTGAARLRVGFLLAGVAFVFACALTGRRNAVLADGRDRMLVGLLCMAAAAALSMIILLRSPSNAGPYAGAIVTLLPLSWLMLSGSVNVSYVRDAGSPVSWFAAAALLAISALAIFSLLRGGEPSSLVALIVAAISALIWARIPDGAARWLLVLMALAAVVVGVLMMSPLFEGSLGAANALPLPAKMANRIALWHDAAPLLSDYWYTGSGLASTPMVFASYALLTHVPYVYHVHNQLLQTGLELGAVGVVGLTGMAIAAVVAIGVARRDGAFGFAASVILASWMSTVLLGLIDSEVYASPLAPVLFIPFGLALLLESGSTRATAGRGWPWWSPVLLAVPTALTVLMLTRPAVQSQWLSNRASLMQTRVELSPHDPSVWSLQDNIRRVYAAQLVPAVDMYQRALTLNPRNISAHRRLGQIELSLGRNDSAFAHLAEAYRLADGQRVTRQLLGEMQALEGNVASAVRLWQPLDLSHNQLDARMWWYSERGDIEASSALAAAVRSFNSGASAGAPGTVNP